MGKRNWGRIAKWTAVGTLGTIVGSCAGFNYLFASYQAEDTAAVTAAMKELAQKPVRLMNITPECLTGQDNACHAAYFMAKNNAGFAKFDGDYYATNHKGSSTRAFKACARNHGWSNCDLALDGAKNKRRLMLRSLQTLKSIISIFSKVHFIVRLYITAARATLFPCQ